VQTSLALFDRIFEYLDLPIDIAERPGRTTRARTSPRRRRLRPRVGSATTRTRLDARGRLVRVPAGTTTALVGETGAGKTTLGYLVARLYDVNEGRVTIDGSTCATSRFGRWRRRSASSPRRPTCSTRRVRENLRFAKPGRDRRGDRGRRRRGADPRLIAALPEGYDTVVGERGYRFSGGEKQRIAIARTILRNPPMLVLDEATSARSTRRPSALVQEALDRPQIEGRTTIAIAHRLSTIRDADQIVVLDGGFSDRRARHARRARSGAGRRAATRRCRRRAAARGSPQSPRSSKASASRGTAVRRFAAVHRRHAPWRAGPSMLPRPPHWATSCPPGRSAARKRPNSRWVVADPVKRGGREDRVDGLVDLQLEQVQDAQLRASIQPAPGRLDHRLGLIDAITRPAGGARSAPR
jgi:ATP-binding cassette subfamily B protein